VFGDCLAGDLLKVPARLCKPGCFQQCFAELEAAADQIVQRNAFDRNVAPILLRTKVDLGIALERDERLELE